MADSQDKLRMIEMLKLNIHCVDSATEAPCISSHDYNGALNYLEIL